MSNIDKQALREIAAAAVGAHERLSVMPPDDIFDISLAEGTQLDADITALNALNSAANPTTVLALLDELERNQQYIKSRDQENEDIALTVGKLLIENGRLVADTLRHLADNEIDSDYFAITSTNENGTEIDHEMAITDYALQAAGTVDELVAALESAEKRIAELESNEVREVGNQFLVVRHPGKTPVIKHCTGDLEEFLRKLIEQDPLVTIDIITHRYYGIGGQWVQDAVEYLHMMSDAGIRIKGE
ncbi:TPA: ead/Ea22-like family protein [Escherichia coli]|nr:ead/Ea22-like family protein [Escherichia coli]